MMRSRLHCSHKVRFILIFLSFSFVNLCCSESNDDWQSQFHKVYQLEPGMLLKHIDEPFIPERLQYYFYTHPHKKQAIPQGPQSIIFSWDGELDFESVGFSVDGGRALSSLLQNLGLVPSNYKADEKILQLRVMGDWIFDKKATLNDKLDFLEIILKEKLNQPLSFKINMVEQEVIVATGTYKFKRSPFHTSSNQDAILIYANKPNYKSSKIEAGTFPDLVQFLRKRTALEIIDETDSSSKRIYWQVMQQPFYAEHEMNYEILNTISKQSGFVFKKEMRILPVLNIIRKEE